MGNHCEKKSFFKCSIPNDPNPLVSVAEVHYISNQPSKKNLKPLFLSHPFAEHVPFFPATRLSLTCLGPFLPGYIPWQTQNLWTVAIYDTWVNWTGGRVPNERYKEYKEYAGGNSGVILRKVPWNIGWLMTRPLEWFVKFVNLPISQGLI